MRPIRLAIIFDQEIQAGGGYQQALNAALLTRQLPASLVDLVFYTTLDFNISTLAGHGIQAELIQLSFFDKVRAYLRRMVIDPFIFRLISRFEKHSPFEKRLVAQRIDLVYFLAPSVLARDLDDLNYITTVWDLCHRDDPEFPEVRRNRELEKRDRFYQAVLPRAIGILVDSELGRRNAARRYGVDEERIHVMPFQAGVTTRGHQVADLASTVSIREKYRLDVPYVFYPAQFWAHKNHIYLLEGLRILEQRHGLSVGALFSGGDQGNQAYVERYVHALNLADRVRFAGFIPNEEIPELYRQSIALVMPTYFGPTNLPPLEAFELGVPVLYPDKAGLRDQVGDAALLIDLTNPASMADHLQNLIEDKDLRNRLIQAGRKRLADFDVMDRVGVLRSVLENFRWKRLCWE